MIVSIHQPYYFPWLGYFEKILRADIFVILDDVQYEKNNFYNRNKINTPNGPTWITVPVEYKKEINLMDITIDLKQKWQKKHFDSIYFNYKKAPYFKEHEEFFYTIYKEKRCDKLIDLNLYTLNYFIEALQIETPIKYASNLNIKSTATQRLVDITQAVDATTYLSGSSGKKYMQIELFKDKKIDIIYQDYHTPQYKQLTKHFEPNMCIIDLLLNHGPKSKEIILSTK
jgi:hypothetical protein